MNSDMGTGQRMSSSEKQKNAIWPEVNLQEDGVVLASVPLGNNRRHSVGPVIAINICPNETNFLLWFSCSS